MLAIEKMRCFIICFIFEALINQPIEGEALNDLAGKKYIITFKANVLVNNI